MNKSNEQNRKVQETAPVPATLASVEAAARSLSIGRTAVFALIKEGTLKSVKIGKRRLIPVTELEAFAGRM